MTSLETYFTMQTGKAIYPDVEKYLRLIASLTDGYYINKITRVTNIRSLDQNNAMWGIPYMYFKRALTATGNFKNISDKQVHEWVMHHCLPEDYKERILNEWKEDPGMVDVKTGEVFKAAFRLTTTKMTTVDSMHYYDNMQQFYSEWLSSGKEDDVIPDPDPKKKKRN